jgi:hypothetical protein
MNTLTPCSSPANPSDPPMNLSRIISIAFFSLGALALAMLTILPTYPDLFSSIFVRGLFATGAAVFGWEAWMMLWDTKSDKP